MCEKAKKKGITPHNTKAAWPICGIYPFNKFRVTTNPQYTEMSRNVLSSTRFITRGDLQTTRHGQEEPEIKPKRKRTQKEGGEPSTKRGRPKHQVKDEDVIRAADSEVERQVQALGGGG
jgi:hypothetical protein